MGFGAGEMVHVCMLKSWQNDSVFVEAWMDAGRVSLQNRFYNTPLVHWTHAWQQQYRRISMKTLVFETRRLLDVLR